MRNTYTKVEPKKVEKYPKTCSYLESLREMLREKMKTQMPLQFLRILDIDDQLDLVLLKCLEPLHVSTL